MSPDTQFDELDAEIETLRERLEAYARGIFLARAAIWGGGLVLCAVLTFAGSYRTPVIVFGAISAVLGGTVWFGATTSSRTDVEGRLAEVEAHKAKLFDAVAARNGWVDLAPTVH